MRKLRVKDKRTEGKHGVTVSATLGCLFSSSKKGDNSGLPGLGLPFQPQPQELALAGWASAEGHPPSLGSQALPHQTSSSNSNLLSLLVEVLLPGEKAAQQASRPSRQHVAH